MLKKMFGRSSEKLDPNQLLMDALMLQAQDTFAEPVLDGSGCGSGGRHGC
ncbi:MAG: transposase [Verrucomicrobia bacterium]|nr:transposase [Verrucomicrobiota bacterium]